MSTESLKNDIPIIDFATFRSLSDANNIALLKPLSNELYNALHTIGFAYIKNHGIDLEIINDEFRVSNEFFNLPIGIKQKYSRSGFNNNHGWDALELEKLDPNRPADFKEGYYVTPQHAKIWPDENVTNFKANSLKLFDRCVDLAHRVLISMAIGLQLEDPFYFSSKHHIIELETTSSMRVQYYPSFENICLKPNQVRCGEHTDYGSLTLLFQDDVGGLEVLSRTGEYVQAKPIPGTVLINIADLMQRWSGDRLVSTSHRVLVSSNGLSSSKSRLSIAFFVSPDYDTIIETIRDGTQYPPIRSKDYLEKRYAETY